MADAHEEHGTGGSPYSFLFILAGVVVAALVFQSIRTGTSLFSPAEKTYPTTSSATSTPKVAAVRHPRAHAPIRTLPQEHWTTIVIDQNNEIMSITHTTDQALDRARYLPPQIH